jgi:ubiquinone/menaquinone biosynthesis C-methylase UbiE
MGYLLASPIRRLYQNPEKIVEPYVKSGMTVLEVGPGMGFFTLPMARIVGENGLIICTDIQEKMLIELSRRTKRAGLAKQVTTRLATADSLGVNDFSGQVDFTLAFAVVHEVPNHEMLFGDIHKSMKAKGVLLICEPTGHVTPEEFEKMVTLTKSVRFEELSRPNVKRSISILLKKRG